MQKEKKQVTRKRKKKEKKRLQANEKNETFPGSVMFIRKEKLGLSIGYILFLEPSFIVYSQMEEFICLTSILIRV